MDNNEAYGASIHIGVGDISKLANSSESMFTVTILYISSVDSNEAYGVQLQQNSTQQEFEENAYDYPMMDINHIETKANEAYATAVVHL